MFPACLVSTVFVVQKFKTLLLMASGVDLGARRASIMSISWGGLGGLCWAVFVQEGLAQSWRRSSRDKTSSQRDSSWTVTTMPARAARPYNN